MYESAEENIMKIFKCVSPHTKRNGTDCSTCMEFNARTPSYTSRQRPFCSHGYYKYIAPSGEVGTSTLLLNIPSGIASP